MAENPHIGSFTTGQNYFAYVPTVVEKQEKVKANVTRADLAKAPEGLPKPEDQTRPLYITPRPEDKTEEQKKAEDPTYGLTFTPEEVKAAEDRNLRIDLGIAGYRKSDEDLSPQEKRISDAVREEIKTQAIKTEEDMKAVGTLQVDGEITEAERTEMARHLWQKQIENPSVWKSLNYAQKAVMVEWQFNNNKEWNQLRDQFGAHQDWWTLIKHGAWSYGKSIGSGPVGAGTLIGISDTMQSQMELSTQNEKARNGLMTNFVGTLNQFKKDPKSRDKDKVERIYKKFIDKPELFRKDFTIKDPAFLAELQSLNQVEQLDLFIRLNHKKGKDSFFGKDRPSLSIDDFDLNLLDEKWDPKTYDYTIDKLQTLYTGASFGNFSGTGLETAFTYSSALKAYDTPEIKAGRKNLYQERAAKVAEGKVDPLMFALENMGKGAFRAADKDHIMVANAGAAGAYGVTLGKAEGAVAGAMSLGLQVFGAGEDPETWWNRAKMAVYSGGKVADVRFLVAWYDAAMNTQNSINEWSTGGKSQIGARLMSAIDPNMTLEQAQALFKKHGALNAEFINVGMMQVMPSAIVGRGAVFNGAAMRGGLGTLGAASRGINFAKDVGILSIDRARRLNVGLYKIGSKVQAIEAGTFGLPVKIFGAVTLGTGKTMVYATGGAFQALVTGATKLANKLAPELTKNAAETGGILKGTLAALGVTSAFKSFDLTAQLAAFYGIGKGAEAAGGLLYKYGYKGTNLSGRTFQGALAAASKDAELGIVARKMASIGNIGWGIPAAATYDFVKGGWHGGGVGFGLGFLQDGVRGGVNGIWGGVGMGGAGATHGVFQMYRAGIYTHSLAENELRLMMKDAPIKGHWEDLINTANNKQDWNLIPLAVGAIKMAGRMNINVHLFDENDAPDLGIEILREELINPADYTVTGKDAAGNPTRKQFLIPAMKAAAESARNKAAQLSASAKTEADFAAAEAASKAADKAELDLHREFNEWLAEIRLNGTQEQKSRVRSGTTLFRGLHISGGVGNGTIYINTRYMKNTTLAHEVFHGVQSAVARSQAVNYFANTAWGIKLLDGKLVAQDGAISNLDLLRNFADLNNDVLYATPEGADQATKDKFQQARDTLKADLEQAFNIINMDPAQVEAQYGVGKVEAAHELLRKTAEEFGANYFESFLERNRPDYLFRGGKYDPMRRLLMTVENYMDFNLRHDLEGNGIDLNVQATLSNRRSAEYADKMNKISAIRSNMQMINERLAQLRKITNIETGEWVYTDKALAERLERKLEKWRQDGLAIEKSLGKREIGDVFRDSSGAYLVIPALDKSIKDIIRRSAEKEGSNPLSLASLSPAELKAYLTRAGLEHWLDPKTGKLKSEEQINAESVQRGKKALDVLKAMPSSLSGVVIHTDEFGTRASGMLTKDAIDALVQNDAILPVEAKNALALMEAIKSALGVSVLSGTEVNILYHALSVESYDADGNVVQTRKPKHTVDPTHRKIVPYRLDLVLTTKDANGNKVEPHFQMMVTALDLGVLMNRGAKNFNATYTLPSGRVVRASDLFGGSFEVFKHHLQQYLFSMSQDIAPAGADVFGGGETGEAIRDIMYNTVGAIATTGKDNAGNPLLIKNNPIISPLKPAKRGPDFVFTTFRVDLMSDLSVGSQRWVFNERRAYPRVQQNYSAVVFGESVEKNGGLKEMRGVHEFEILANEQTGENETVKVNYTVYQKKDELYYIRANDRDVGVSGKFGFRTAEEAMRFAHLASQRHMLAAKNALSSTFLGGDKGILVSNIEGNYLLIDTTQNGKIISERIYRNEVEAVLEATRLHNKRAIDNFRSRGNESQIAIIEHQLRSRENAGGGMEEALPPRLHIGKGGKLKFEPVKVKTPSGKSKQAVYGAGDIEVKTGLAKAGDKKYRVEFQKVGYNLMNILMGDQTLRMDSPVVQRFVEMTSDQLAPEALAAIKIPEVRKALSWYRHMVKNGNSVFGSMYGLFTESIGATSSRTDVEQNFAQAEEAMAMFSQGKYDATLAKIHAQIVELNRRLTSKDSNNVSLFEAEAIDMLRADKAFQRTLDEFSISKEDFDMFDFLDPKSENRSDISQEALLFFEKNLNELRQSDKKTGLTPKQLGEALHKSLSKIFRSQENLMLRANGKKYNANTVKVGQVMYGMWRQLTDGPKTPNFAGNLEGAIREATIDVWAARTLHRVINTKILKRQKWRLLPSMEKGVDYAWHDHGVPENPNVQVGGDFGFGQEVFKKTADKLRDMHPDFKDVTPDDLQALMWFFEKGFWAERGWTEYAGAEMSSFEGPMWRFAGSEDPSGVEAYSNVRRIIAGITGSYGPESIRFTAGGEPIELGAVARNQAQPQKVLDMVKGVARGAFGEALRAANITQTYGLYGGSLEHSVSFDTIAQRGRFSELENILAKAKGKRDDAELAMNEAAEVERTATGDQKKEAAKAAKAKRSTFEKHDAAYRKAAADLAGERSAPKVTNQLGILAEGLIEIARNYMQKDVMVSEVVGEKHPNARPALDIIFQKTLTLSEVQALSTEITNASGGYVGGFTFIPEPRNPNGARLSRLTKLYERMKVDGKIPESRKSQAEALKAEIEKLALFKGIQTIANPEQTYRYRQYSDIPEIKSDSIQLMTENGARTYMRGWAGKLREILPNYQTHNGNRLTLNEYFVSTDTINAGGYDTFNPADIGASTSLGHRLERYRQTLDREAASYAEQERGLVGSADSTAYTPDRTSWLPTETAATDLPQRENTFYTAEQKQTGSSKTPNLVVSAEQAADWVRNAFQKPNKGEAGISWGDRHYTIYQKRNADGSLSNEFRVIGAYDRKPTVVQGREAAVAEVTARLTGQKTGAAGERTITVNGVNFTVTEGMRPVVGPEGKAAPEIGAFEKQSKIWDFSALDPFEAQQQLHGFGSMSHADVFRLARTGAVVFSDRARRYTDHLNANFGAITDGSLTIDFKVAADPIDCAAASSENLVHTDPVSGQKYYVQYNSGQSDAQIVAMISTGGRPIPYTFGHQNFTTRNVARIVTRDANGQFVPVNARTADQATLKAITEATLSLRSSTDDTFLIPDFGSSKLTDPAGPSGGGQGMARKKVAQRFRTNGNGEIIGSVGDRVDIGSANVLDGGVFYFSKEPSKIIADIAPDAFTPEGEAFFLREMAALFDPAMGTINTANIQNRLVAIRREISTGISDIQNTSAGGSATGNGRYIKSIKGAEYIHKYLDLMATRGGKSIEFASAMKVKSGWAEMVKMAELLRGAGSALNGHNAAMLHAIGTGTPDTRGVESFIVNKTGAVFKTREKAYGSGNTMFYPHDSLGVHPRAGMPTADINEAILRTRNDPQSGRGGVTSDIVTVIQPNRAYSAAEHIGLERAFNFEPDKYGWSVASAGNGALFSDRARKTLPKNIEIHTRMDSAGNLVVRAIDSNNHNWSESVAKKNPKTNEPMRDEEGMLIWEKLPEGQRQGEEGILFEFSLGIGRHWPKEGSNAGKPLPKPTGDATIEQAWRAQKDPTRDSWNDDLDVDLGGGAVMEGELQTYFDKRSSRWLLKEPHGNDPKLEAAVIAEVAERLRQSGLKRLAWDKMGSTQIYDQIRSALGAEHYKFQQGWEMDEPVWKIEPKKAYSAAESADRYEGLPDHMKALSDEYTRILSRYGMSKRSIMTSKEDKVRADVKDEGNVFSIGGEAFDRQTQRDVFNIAPEDLNRLQEITGEFAKFNGYHTQLAHASRSKNITGPMSGKYSDMGVSMHAGIKGEPYSIGGFGEYRHPFRATGTFFDINNQRHRDAVEKKIDQMIKEGRWIKSDNGRLTPPSRMAKIYKVDSTAGAMATIQGTGGQFHSFERLGLHTNFTDALKELGFTGYKERESTVDFGELPHAAVLGSEFAKISDPVTFDSTGKVVPIHDRFNIKNPDPRYSPTNGDTPEGFVSYERLFNEEDATASLYSNTAKAKLRDYRLDFEQITDQELREGMDDAPMGANKLPDTTHPMSVVRLTQKGSKESSVEFYLMVNRDREEGRSTQYMSRMAILQMTRKKGDLTIDPLVGALSEIAERLKMTGVTQIFVPKKAWADMAIGQRQVAEKLRKQAQEMGAEHDIPDERTIIDEHDGLRIVMGDNLFGNEVTMGNGKRTLMYTLKRNKQYSAAESGEKNGNSVTGEPNQALINAALRASDEKKKGKGNGK